MRARHPTKRILQTKADWKSAYRRLHQTGKAAGCSATYIDGILLLALRVTFGGAANPSQWSDVAEMSFDMSNDLIRNDGWDPSRHVSPYQHLIGDTVNFLPESVPIALSLPVIVNLPEDTAPKCEGYLDDSFVAMLEDDIFRGSRILPFVIHLLCRPVHPDENEYREATLSLKKFLAEATPDELKLVLGWVLDARRLLVSLPDDKFHEWVQAIDSLLEADAVSGSRAGHNNRSTEPCWFCHSISSALSQSNPQSDSGSIKATILPTTSSSKS